MGADGVGAGPAYSRTFADRQCHIRQRLHPAGRQAKPYLSWLARVDIRVLGGLKVLGS
jgi:hypothetical protein